MKRLLPLERLVLQILATHLILLVLFLIVYWDLLESKEYLQKTVTFTSGLFAITLISTGFTMYRTLGCGANAAGLTHVWQRMAWTSIEEVGYIRDSWGRMKLYVHTKRAAMQIPMRTLILYGDSFLKYMPQKFHDKVSWGLEKNGLSRMVTAELARKAQLWTLGVTVFSLIMAKTVWYLPYFYAGLWTSMALLIPLLWLLSLMLIMRLYPKLLTENFSKITLFNGYLFGALYLWYGIIFRMNLYY